jgi:hypothetical protein
MNKLFKSIFNYLLVAMFSNGHLETLCRNRQVRTGRRKKVQMNSDNNVASGAESSSRETSQESLLNRRNR